MSIISVLQELPPPPCEKFMCKMKEQCKSQKLACDSFRNYVSNGIALSPYISIYGNNSEKGKIGKFIDCNKENYKLVFEGENEVSI